MKQRCLEYYVGSLNRGQITGFVASKFNDFIKWCSSNERTVFEFKQSLNIDVIFNIIVKKSEEIDTEIPILQNLSNLGNFLEWYLGNLEEVNKFKSSAMIDYKESGDLKKALQQGRTYRCNYWLRLNWRYVLWRDKIYNKTQCNRSAWVIWDSTWFEWINEFCCKEVLVVPSKIAYLVDNRIKLRSVFSIIRQHRIQTRHYHLFEKYRRVLTDEDGVETEIKYKLACEYCLEGYVRQIWTSVQNDANASGQSSLVLYWNNVMTDRANQESVESRITALLDKNKPAFEYFWGKLTEERQILWTIKVLGDADIAIMKTLLPMLNETQLEIVCGEVGDCIFAELMEIDDNFEHAMKSWIYMKDFVPGSIFCSIIRRLWEIVFNHADLDFFGLDRSNSLLLELWASAPDRLKDYILEKEEFLDLFCELDSKTRGVDSYRLEFIFELLTKVSHEIREEAWKEVWPEFVVRANPSKLEEIMKLCFTNETELQRFKTDDMPDFDELYDYFRGCVKKGFYEEMSELPEFHSFVRQTFRSVETATEFMDQLILSEDFWKTVQYELESARFDKVMKLCGGCPTARRNVAELKRKVFDQFSNIPERTDFSLVEISKLEDFLKWCSSERSTVAEFKRSLNIDRVFAAALNGIFANISHDETSMSQQLSNVDNFLLWYFGCEEAAIDYKANMLLFYRKRRYLNKRLESGDHERFDQVLNWAYNKNPDVIADAKRIVGR
ncbi:hypothetical protein U1Q18_048573 [Sarracenia purpurea var. burkii]